MRKIFLLLGVFLCLVGLFVSVFDTPYKFLFQSNAYISSGKVAKALKLLETGYQRFPKDQKIAFSLAKVYFLSGETEIANKILISSKVYKTIKGNQELKNFLADIAESNYTLGNKKYAELFAREYLSYKTNYRENSTTAKNLIRIGKILSSDSEEIWEEAFNIAHALKKQEIKDSIKALLLPRYLERINYFKKEKQYQKALKVFERAKVLGPCPEVSFQEAKLLIELKRYDDAQKKFEEALQLAPENDEYKIYYAEALRKLALANEKEKDVYYGKIKLLLAGDEDPRKISILKKIMNLNAKYKIKETNFFMKQIGDYLYPSLVFKIEPVSDVELRRFKVVFFNAAQIVQDTYESPVTENEFNQIIEVTSKQPLENKNNIASAQLFLNDDLVKEFTHRN